MQPDIYRQIVAAQDTHWWFVARRHILARLIASLDQHNPSVLEIGCGPGGNLPMLARLGPLCAVELDDYALSIARQRTPTADIRRGWLPENLPFADRQFDLICLFDVLEHVEDDHAALTAIAQRLTPTGYIILTVPAYAWLYGPHDRTHHHHRRYTARALCQHARAAGLQPERSGYFNTLLFAPIALVRLFQRITARSTSTAKGPSPVASTPPARLKSALNRALTHLFATEALVIPYTFLPFGISAIAILRHPPTHTTQ